MRGQVKKLLIIAALALCPALRAQSLAVGGAGGYSFSNYFVGPEVTASVDVHRVRLGAYAELDPFLSHTALGRGYGFTARPEAWLYLGRSWSLYGALDTAGYRAGEVHKTQFYARAGLTLNSTFMGDPARYTFAYVREVHNGLLYGGTESSHLQAGLFRYEWPITRRVRLWQEIVAGGVLEQGNPKCDGTCGPKVTCPRRWTMSGGTTTGVEFVFGKTR